MKRAYGLDVLACPRCSARMELLALIEDEATAKQILTHLGLSTRAPPRGRRRRSSEGSKAGVEPVEDFDGFDPPSAVE
jgi:hypothetical protein